LHRAPLRRHGPPAARVIQDLKELCHGAHLITIGQERRIPQILQEAGLVQAEK
jgi:5,10-methylenetetrahydrofolate reductase